jgi:xylulokinase
MGCEPLLRYPEIVPPSRIVAIGGGVKNELLMWIKASVMGRAYTVIEVEEAGALGAAMLGGLGAGVYAGVENAIAALRYERREVSPDPAVADQYDLIYRTVYTRLYPGLAPLSHAIDDVQGSLASPTPAG